MVSFNRVVLAGNLTRDPELRFTSDGVPVANFGLAQNVVSSKSDHVNFFDISAWRELGETVANYKKKGDPVLVEGRLQFRTWEAQDGSKRNKVDVVAENIQFLGGGAGQGNGEGGNNGSAGRSSGGSARSSARSSAGSSRRGGRVGGEEIDDDMYEDIPFAEAHGAKARLVRDIL